MTTQAILTATQTTILKAASTRPGGNIEALPPALRGGARARVIGCLMARGLVAASEGSHMLTDAGYAAVGKRRTIPKGVQNMDIPGATVKPDTNSALQKLEAIPRTVRPGWPISPSWPGLRGSKKCVFRRRSRWRGWHPALRSGLQGAKVLLVCPLNSSCASCCHTIGRSRRCCLQPWVNEFDCRSAKHYVMQLTGCKPAWMLEMDTSTTLAYSENLERGAANSPRIWGEIGRQ
jgi:hypothetical protein